MVAAPACRELVRYPTDKGLSERNVGLTHRHKALRVGDDLPEATTGGGESGVVDGLRL